MRKALLPISLIATLSVTTIGASLTETSSQTAITIPKITTNLTIAETSAPMSVLDPLRHRSHSLQSLQQAYDFTPLYQMGYQGQGQTVAVVLHGANEREIKQDLNLLDFRYHLQSPDIQFVYPEGQKNNPQYRSDNAEPIADISYVHAFAPAAKILCVVDNDTLGAFLYLSQHHSASIVTYSYDEPEIEWNGTLLAGINDVLHQLANDGVSMFMGTGDWGASDKEGHIKKPSWANHPDLSIGEHVNFPASSLWVTAVGGTTLQMDEDRQYTSETGWPYSGGGYSTVFSRPQWQYAAGLPDDADHRAIPDVAFNADLFNGFPLYYNARLEIFGGTSVAAPAWAAILAIANQVNGKPIGYLNPKLYQLADSSDYRQAFHDVTSGSNGYASRPGWDAVTGLGTPDVYHFVKTITQGRQHETQPAYPYDLPADAYLQNKQPK